MISYTLDNLIDVDKEDLEYMKRDLFRRYNFGMTPLSRSEVARARYFYDSLTEDFIQMFEEEREFYQKCIEVLLPKTKRGENIEEREKINLLLVTIRELIVTPYIPIIGEKSVRLGAAVIDKYYTTFIKKFNAKERIEKLNEFRKIFNKLYLIKEKLKASNNSLQDNILFFKSTYWMFSILYKIYPDEFYKFNNDKFYHYIQNGAQDYFDNYRNISAIHIERRHAYVKDYMQQELKLEIDTYLEKVRENKKEIIYKKLYQVSASEDWNGVGADKQLITAEETMEISEIIRLTKQRRFIVRPDYQRTEVKSRTKASKIIESIILGVKLPPIYLYTKIYNNGLSRDIVLDGQQRLISILKYMGESVTNEEFEDIKTYKNKYALTGLKDLDGLNGKVYEEGENSLNLYKRQPIQDYIFDVIRINERANENVDFVDMFIRLNQNPCPISENSFEMWNSFDITTVINKIKEVARYKLFKQYGNNMKEEELVTILAYMHNNQITIENMNKLFRVYLYVENKDKQDEHSEVKISINKKCITTFLEDMQPNSKEEKEFLISVNAVSDFIDKLKVLSNNDEKVLIKMFNPNLTIARKANKKDFYIVWLILQKMDTHLIFTYKEEIIKDLEKTMKLMKNMPQNKTIEDFINYVKSVINKYHK